MTDEKTEIVRCKECKHRPIVYGETENGFDVYKPDTYDDICPYLCEDGYYSRMPKDDWFCNFGERKSIN